MDESKTEDIVLGVLGSKKYSITTKEDRKIEIEEQKSEENNRKKIIKQ